MEAAFTARKLARPLYRAFGAFPAKMVVDTSWLAELPFFGLGAFEAEHRTEPKLDGSMILFDQIVQIF